MGESIEARVVDRIELHKRFAHSHLADLVPKPNKLIELSETNHSSRKAHEKSHRSHSISGF